MTRRFLTYVVLILIAYAFYSYTASPLLLAVVLFMVSIALISFLALLLGSFGLRVRGTVSPREIKRLEPFTLSLELLNRGPVYLSAIRLSIGHPTKRGRILALPTDEADEADYDELAEQMIPRRASDEERTRSLRTLFSFWGKEANTPSATPQNGSDDDHLLRSRLFYRPGNSYPLHRKALLYPRPRFVDEQKLRYFSLAPGQKLEQDFEFIANHKGSVYFGVDHLLLKDWFGFFSLPRKIRIIEENGIKSKDQAAYSLNIQPSRKVWTQAISPHLTDPKQVLMAPQSVKVSPEIDTLANIRAYQPGDKMKSIHWNISARTGEWLVREFEDPRQGGLLFVLEPTWPRQGSIRSGWEDSFVDQMTEVMASFLDHFYPKEGPLTLLSGNRDIEAAGEGQPPDSLYRELAVWRPQTGSLELAMVLRQVMRTRTFRGVVIVTSTVSSGLEAEVLRLQRQGSQVVLAVLHPEEATREELDERTKLVRMAKVMVLYFPCQALRIPPVTDLAEPIQGPEPTTDTHEVPT